VEEIDQIFQEEIFIQDITTLINGKVLSQEQKSKVLDDRGTKRNIG
jgi:hypothetical protein